MKATDILKQEHELILEMLQIVDAACAKMEEGEKIGRAHV